MKPIIILCCSFLISFQLLSQAVAWELSSEAGNQATSVASLQTANFNNCVLSRGAGITATAGAGSMNSSAWFSGSTPTTLANAIAGNDYYEFTINTINCLFFNPTTIKMVLRSSATGPNTATLRCSSDGFTTDIGTVAVGVTSVEVTFSESISPNSQTVTYRLYGYGAAAGGGTPGSGGTMRIGTSVVAADFDIQFFASTTFLAVNQESNLSVIDGDVVPASSFIANVPGASFNWSRTPESIGLAATNGMGNVPSFNAFNATSSPITSTLTVNAMVGNCTSPDMIYTITVNPAPCTITVDFFGNPSACDDNGTPNDPSDDFFTQNIHASFFNRPFTGSLQIVPGGDQIGVYSILANQIIGNAHTFNGVQLKADGTPSIVQMNFTDDPTCIDADTGPTVQPCSTPPPPCTITVDFFGNPSACDDNGTPNDPSDDFFTQNIHASFFNRPFTGLLQIVPGGDQIGVYSIPTNQIIGNAHTFNGVQLKADGTPSVVQMNFTDDPTCIDADTGPTVQPCSASLPCDITSVTFNTIGSCNNNGTNDPSDDFFTANVVINFINPPPTGNLQIEPGGDAIGVYSIPVGNLVGNSHTFNNVQFKADGMVTVVEAEFTIPANVCTQTAAGPTVTSCSPVCDISNVSFNNVGACNDNGTTDPLDDYFTANILVNFINPPQTGNLQIEPGGDAIGVYSIPVGSLIGSSHTFTNVQLKANGTITVIEVEFTIPSGLCVETETGPIVQPCSSSPPVITCPAPLAVSCTGNVPSPNPASVSETHDCPGGVIKTHVSDQTTNQTCTNRFVITRTYKVEDLCGHTSTCTQIITVNDQTPPLIACPINITVQCAALVPQQNVAAVQSTDNCGGLVSITFLGDVNSNVVCTNRFIVTRTYRAIDACGNSATCQQTITVLDNTGPAMTCPAALTFQCASDVPQNNTGLVTSTDNCNGAATISFVNDIISNQTCPNKFTLTRTYRATDICGNSSTCSQTIIVNDNILPSLTCPAGFTVQCASQVPASNVALVTATDNCSGTPTISFVADVITNMTCVNRFTISRIYRTTDLCGNSATCTQTIIVNDNTVPTLTCPQNVTVQCAAQVPSVNTASVVTADNCGGTPTVTFVNDVISNQSCLNRFVVTRTYRSTDACGNSATCTQMITVFDNTSPVITFTDPLIANLQTGGRFDVQCFGQDPDWDLPALSESSVSVSDNCAGNVTIHFSQLLQDEGNCPVDGYITLYKLTWTATDACGNTSSRHVFMALVDHIAPILFNVPSDITVNCDEIPDPPANVYATDECISASNVQYASTAPSPGCQNGQVINRSWTAADLCGNKTTETQYITLIDVKPPVLAVLQPELAYITGDITLQYTCNEGGIPEFFDDLNAESVYSEPSCGSAATIKFERSEIHSVNCKRAGYLDQQTFHWIAVDACGNKTNLTIIAQLVDVEAPVILGVPEIACIDDPDLKFIEATDNCGDAFLQYWDVKIPNPCGTGLAIKRTYEAYDHCGNSSRDTSILIPNDHLGPALIFINPKLLDLPPGEVLLIDCAGHAGDYTPFSVDDVTVADGCSSEVTVTFKEKVLESNGCVNGIVATLSLVWTASDICGNVTTKTIEAFVVDHSTPVIVNFKPEVTIGCNEALPSINATDNCGDVAIEIEENTRPGTCDFQYDVTRVITVTDPCGNVTTATQIVHVGNGSGPVISGVVDEICDDLSIPDVKAYDPCSDSKVDVMMTEEQLDSQCREGKIYQRTWTATDACGNVSTETQIIIVGDKTAPEIQIPTWSIILKYLDAAPGSNYVNLSNESVIDKLNDLDDGSVYVEDECDLQVIPVFTLDVSYAGNCDENGYYEYRVYTWTATDICGNQSVVTFDVYIVDDIAPELQGVPADATYTCVPLPGPAFVSSDDPAQPVSIVFNQTIVPGDGPGELFVVRTWTGTDACGNVSTATQHIKWISDTQLECEIIAPLVECNTHGVAISSLITGGLGTVTYEWEVFGPGFIQSGQGTDEITIYVGWTTVVVNLTVRDVFGCESECSVIIDCLDSAINPIAGIPGSITPEAIVGLDAATNITQEKSDLISELAFWPNPANGGLNMSFDSRSDQEVNLRLINFLGQDMIYEKLNAIRGHNSQMLDVSHLPEGSYLMEVKTDNGVYTKVVVIMRK